MEPEAIKRFDSDTLIISSPGTGKTTAIVNRVVELLKNGASEEDILCITFTEKAANEMRERIIKALHREKTLSSMQPGKIGVYTFHGYAYSYLEELGIGRELSGNNALRYSIYKSFKESDALNYSDSYIIESIVPKVENAIRYLKSFGILPDSIEIGKAKGELKAMYMQKEIENVSLEETEKFMEYFINAFRAYEKEKNEELKRMDYNDMLIEFLRHYDKGKRHYAYVLVDELQDVNDLEREIAMVSGESRFLVGDRKQSIFGFQGGSLNGFESFKSNGVRIETLKVNYRSLQGILDYAKKVFLSNTSDKSYAEELDGLKGNREGNADIGIIIAKDQEAAAVGKLQELLASKKAGETYAIITRTNGQIVSLSKMLEALGIEHSTTVGGHSSSIAKAEILAYIKGLLYDDAESAIAALFTPFSGLSLKEAFEISEKAKEQKNAFETVLAFANDFKNVRSSISMESLPKLFIDRILPISVSMGREYYLTANEIYRNIREFFSIAKNPSRKELFDFLAITEEEYEPMSKSSDVVLTTVHKAKGLEFSKVIYVPADTRDSLSFIDAVVYSIIKAVKGIDVQEELNEESLRVDFVAFTRARDSLYVVIKDRQRERYAVDGIPVSTYEAYSTREPVSWKYDEAYALFVAGRKEEALKELGSKNWLLDAVAQYFKSKNELSYTLLEDIIKPYEFLKKYILGIEEPKNAALSIGTEVHKLAESRFRNRIDESHLSEDMKLYLHNIDEIDKEIKKEFNAVQIDAECAFEVPLHLVFKGINDEGLLFKGKLDAIYESNGRYLILDWKTDRTIEKAAEHRRQLAVYRLAYAAYKNIDESSIDVALGFIGLKGNINTGKMQYKLDKTKPRESQIGTFESRIAKFLKYRDDPRSFMNAVAADESNEPLFSRIMKLIEQNK